MRLPSPSEMNTPCAPMRLLALTVSSNPVPVYSGTEAEFLSSSL